MSTAVRAATGVDASALAALSQMRMATDKAPAEKTGLVHTTDAVAQAVFGAAKVTDVEPVTFRRVRVITLDELRAAFLKYFVEHEHMRVGESSLLPKDDPTLLFINSGMAAMKAYFLGTKIPPQPELCNSQLCLRTNDIDDIGDMHHLTLFEMLGSWSIGGKYFKEGAIRLAYDLLIKIFQFPSEHIYATVYAGNEALGIPYDRESHDAWLAMGLAEDHIVALGEDNMWGPAGDTGPCGPCTEVFYDMGQILGEDVAPAYVPGHRESFDTKQRYMEIWNAGVFMQYNKTGPGVFEPLPTKSVDTGSGLERLCAALNGYRSVYETDILAAVKEGVQEVVGSAVIPEATIRMMTDHLRAATFVMAEGVVPANIKEGYVVRKLIRKVISAGFAITGKSLDFSGVISRIIDRMKEAYPRLEANRERILEIYAKEAATTFALLSKAKSIIDKEMKKKDVVTGSIFSGAVAHDLQSSKGIPMEVTQAYLGVKGITLDLDGFYAARDAHKALSKAARK